MPAIDFRGYGKSHGPGDSDPMDAPIRLVCRVNRGVCRVQYLLGADANEVVVREVPPENLSVRIEQKFSRARDIGAVRAGVRVDEIPLADHVQFIVGQK